MSFIDEIKNIKSEKSDLRKFGITIGIVLGILGGLFLWRQKDYYYYFLVFSFIFIFLGISFPTLLKPIQKIWMSLAVIIGWFMTRVILSILFYLVLTPTGLILRLFGKQFLDLKMDNPKKSYWKYRDPKAIKKSRYEKQF
jgi:hypothetical protein